VSPTERKIIPSTTWTSTIATDRRAISGELTVGVAEPAVIGKPQERATIPDACSANFAIRFHYRGMERTAELPLTPHTIRRVALEASLRDVKIEELIAEIITAMVNKGLFPLVVDHSDPATDRVVAEELS
jgi:hypothetical protein